MERILIIQSKYNHRKNIINNIYDTQNLGLKNYNICNCKLYKFEKEKYCEYRNNETNIDLRQAKVDLWDNTTKLYIQQKVNFCPSNHDPTYYKNS